MPIKLENVPRARLLCDELAAIRRYKRFGVVCEQYQPTISFSEVEWFDGGEKFRSVEIKVNSAQAHAILDLREQEVLAELAEMEVAVEPANT